MKKEINVKIDHVGMFSNRFHPADVMFQLGFSGEGGCKKMPLDENGQPPRCMRFVFDNCYLEFAINRDPEKYGGAEHGINYFEFASTDIVVTRDNAVAQGFTTTDLVHATREADHGEKKGTAVFECVALKDDVIPNIEVESVCHKTRELFYDNHRYLHDNGIDRVEGIILCNDDEDRVEKMIEDLDKFDRGLGDWGEGTAIRKIIVYDRDTLFKEYGICVPQDCRNTGGIIFEAPKGDLSLRTNQFGDSVRRTKDAVVVDLVEQQNVFFVIRNR